MARTVAALKRYRTAVPTLQRCLLCLRDTVEQKQLRTFFELQSTFFAIAILYNYV